MLNILLVALYAVMPVAIMTTDKVPSPVFYIALVVCLAASVWQKAAAAPPRTMLADYKALLLCCGIPVLAVLISCAVHLHWSGSDLEAALRWSLGVPILLWTLGRIKRQTLWQAMWGVYAAALAATAYVVYLAYPDFARPVTKIYNAVSYGNLMLLMGVITLFSLYFPLTSRPRLERAIKVAVAILAFAGFRS